MTAQDRRCPSCGNVVPADQGQHAENLVGDQVRCPTCGERVSLQPEADEPGADEQAGPAGPSAAAAPPGRHEPGESFSGQDTIDGLAEELRDKPS